MDVINKKKTNVVSGSDIDEEVEECLEDLEDIANEIIASSSDSECEPVCKEVHEEIQKYSKGNSKVKEQDIMASQTENESHKIVDKELVQSIKKYIQDFVKGKSETSEMHATCVEKNTEENVNNFRNSSLVHSSDGEQKSDESMSNRNTENKCEIIEGTEIISDNSDWENLESGECSSSEEELHKLYDDDMDYLSDATTVTGEDKSQIKKSVQEYYKKSEECFVSFYIKIKQGLTDDRINIDDCNSFKSKTHSNTDSGTKRMCKVTCHSDYNRAKLILQEFKRKSCLYKKSHRQSDTEHGKAKGNSTLLGIVSQLDNHMNQELCSKLSANLKKRLEKLKKNVKKYEKKVGLKKRERSKKNNILVKEAGRITNDNMELSYENLDGRESMHSQDKTEKSKNKHLESHHNHHNHSKKRIRSVAVSGKRSSKEKMKVSEKVNDKTSSWENSTIKKLTILSYLEDCENSVGDNKLVHKERKSESNVFKKQHENFEHKEKKTSAVSGPNKQSGKPLDKKKVDPDYDNGELFITYSQLIKNENKNCNEGSEEEKCTETKDVSVFALTLSSEYGKHSSAIPFLQDEADECNAKKQSKELNDTHEVNYITRECGLKSKLNSESHRTSSEKTKRRQSKVSNTLSSTAESHLVRSVSTSPLRTSSRSRSNSQSRITIDRERHSRRSKSRSNSLNRPIIEKERPPRRSRSRSSSIILEKETFSKSSKTTPYAYRKKRSRSRSRSRYYKRYRSPSPYYRKRYRSRSRSLRRKRSSDRSRRSKRKYSTSSSEERAVKPRSRTPPRSLAARTPTRSFGDELRRKLKEENEKALALLKLTLAAQDKGQVTSSKLVPFTSSSEEQRKDVTYKQVISETSEVSSSSKTESPLGVHTQTAHTPPLIPLPPLPPSEPQPAPPLPANANDVTVVTTYTSYVPMCGPSQPPQNYIHPPHTNDMYMPYINPEMHHHHPYMYPPPGMNSYQMGSEGVPPMFQQPPPHMMAHPPPNSYGPPFPYMHNAYPVPMPPYQNAPYQGPVVPPNFTCQQNIVTMSSEPPGKKTASSGPILMEIGSDSENSIHSPVLPQNPTIQEAIQFVKQKMLKDDIKKAINENKSGTDSVNSQETENADDVINTENDPNNSEENKHESDECDGLKADNVHNVCSKNNSIKFKPIKFTLQSKARPVVPMNNSDVFGNSDNDCENIPVAKLNPKRTSKEQASEQTSSENGIGTNKVTIERSPVIYSNVLYRSPVKTSGPSKNISGNIPKTKKKKTESETKSCLKIVEIEETDISNKNKDTQLQKKDVKNDSHKKSNESELNNVDKLTDTKKSAEFIEINNYSNIHKTGSTENSYKHTVSKQEEKQNLEGNASEELIVQHVEAVKKSQKKQVIASDAELQEHDANSNTASRNETEFLDKEESVESQKHSSIIKTADTNKTEFLINEKQTELQEPHDHRKTTNEMNFVVNEKSTELEKSDTEDKATSKNESKFVNNENSSKLQVHVCKTSDRNETDSSVGKTNIELQESVVKNKTAIENETEDLYTTQDEEHVNETFNKNHCNKTHNNVVGNKEAKEKIVCELESVVSTDKGAQEKLKVKVTGNDGNKCSDYTNISVEATLKEEKEIKRYGLNVLPDKQCTEVYEKGEYTENGAHAEYVTQEKNNFSTNEANESKNRANTPVSKLLNEESDVLEKTEIESEASNIHRIGTICDKSEVSEDVKGSAEKEVVSNSDIQGSENKQTITDVSICEDRDESKLCSEFTFKENNKTKDAYLHPCELESDRMLLQSDNLLNHKINTKHNLRNKKYNKKQSSPNYMYKKNDKIEDSKVNDNQNLVSGNKTYTNNDTEENNEVRDVPVQKETVKLALVSESDIIIKNQGRKLTDVSKTESDGRSITAAVQSQQADINKVIYKPCPLSKKTPRELTMMFLNDDSDTSTYGIKLKDLRINLVRVKIPPLSSPDCKIHTTSQGNNLVTEMSSGGAPQKKKTGRKKRINSQNDESLLQQAVECVEEKDESSNSLIRSDKLSESASRLCENYKKILEILKSFKSNRLTVEQNKRQRVVMKTVLKENTIDIVPLSNCYGTNVLSKFDKLNAIQGHNKELDYAQKEEWVNKNNSIVLDSDCKSLLQTTEEKLPTLLGSLVSDSHLKDISINCKKQKNKCFEHAEDMSDSSKVMKIKSVHSELMKECNSETEDSLLGEFASNDSNASLTCEQDSSNSLILKINRGRKKKRNIKLCSSTENNDISSTNIDEKNVNENTTSSTFSNEEKISFSRITDSHDISNNTMQADENLNNRGDHLTESAVFDFKDESSRDTALEETYLLFKRRKSLNKEKFKIKKRKITTDDKSDDLVIQPKILRSQSRRSKSSPLEETEVLSPFVTSKETSNTETEISRTSVTDNMSTALCEVNTVCPDESQMVTCKVPVLVSAETKENTENSTNLLASENVKCTDSSRLWEKISHCLNTKCRNVTTQVRFRQFTLHGEVTVEDTHIVSSETEMLSLSDVISALTKLHSTSA